MAKLVFDLVARDKATSQVNKLKQSLQGLTTSKGWKDLMTGAAIGAGIGAYNTVIAAASQIPGAMMDAAQKASDLNEAVNKSQVIFGSASSEVERFAATAATSMGASKTEAIASASAFGNLFTTIGMGREETASMSVRMAQLAGDLASFNNIGVDEAMQKLRSGLVGEAEPLRQVGVLLNEASVGAKAVELGLAASTSKVSEAAKVQARYALILEQTGTAQGDFGRTSDGLANQQRILAAQWENLQTELGTMLLPALQGFVTVLNTSVIPALRDAMQVLKDNAWVLDAFGAAISAILGPGWQMAMMVEHNRTALGGQATAAREAAYVMRSSLQRELIATSDKAGATGTALRGLGASAAAGARSIGQVAQILRGKAQDIFDAGAKAATAYADGFTSRRDAVKTSLSNLSSAIAEAGKNAGSVARLMGVLQSAQIVNGLRDSNPELRAKAGAAFSVIIDQLSALQGPAYAAGAAFAIQWEAGLTAAQKNADIGNRSAQLAYERGKALYDKVKGAFKAFPPISLDTFLGGFDTKTTSAATGAADKIKTSLVSVREAIAGLRAGNVTALVAALRDASVAAGTFAPKVVTAESASKAFAAAVTKAQGELGRLRAGSESSRAAVVAAFANMKAAGLAYYDALHAKNLQAIADARAEANARYDAQIAGINAQVDAARAALQQKQDARELSRLQAALAAASSPEEQMAAQQALADFQDQQSLRALEQQAASQVSALEAQRTHDNDLFTQQSEAENARYEAQKTAFEELIRLTTDSLEAIKGEWDTKNKAILALLRSYTGSYQSAGKAIFDAFSAGLGGVAPQPTTGKLPGRAAGGPVSAGSPYIVGESGPELFVPGSSGAIVPNDALGGGSITLNVSVTGSALFDPYGSAATQLANALLPGLKRALARNNMSLA